MFMGQTKSHNAVLNNNQAVAMGKIGTTFSIHGYSDAYSTNIQ